MSSGPRIFNFEPPTQLLPWSQKRRRDRQVGPIAAARGWLNRDLAVSTEVAVAEPDSDIRRDR
jgi:hypothetical protein